MKRLISLFLISVFILMPVGAKNLVNSTAQVHTEFNITDKDAKIIEFSPEKNVKISRDVDIPPQAKIKAQIIQSQKERRWHKSGFLICKLLNFTLEGVTVDISKYDAYLVAKRYEPLDKKEAAILATELIVMGGASFFAPGVDIGYFFAKGAIQRKKDPNWFKAGVMNAYDNSICWLFLKGKPINLSKNDEIKLSHMEKTDARNLSAKVAYRKDKDAFKIEKKALKAEVREIRKEYKRELKGKNISVANLSRQDKKLLKEQKKMVRAMRKTVKMRSQIASRNKK